MTHRTTFDLASPAATTTDYSADSADQPATTTDYSADRQSADRRSADRQSAALRARRWFLVSAPVLAGIFATVGAVADPAAGTSGDAMLRVYFDNPDALQFKSLGYHWSYAFWILPAMLIVPLVRGRGAWLATITGFVGFVGVSTMPGLLLVDWFDSAIGAAHGMEGHREVTDLLDQMWGVPVFILPGLVGLVLGLPLAMATLWRAGLTRWWGLAAAVGAFAAFMVSDATWPGTVAATVLLSVVSVALAHATRPRDASA